MTVQKIPFASTGSGFGHMGTVAKKAGETKTGNTGSPSGSSLSLALSARYDKMLENIQKQIQKVNENDHYDAETKKSKIEELEKQLKEIEKAKIDQMSESVLEQNKKGQGKGSKSKSDVNEKGSTEEGVVLDLSFNAKAMLEADRGLKNLQSANAQKVQLRGEANVLTSEIKMDKSRGVNTAKKEQHLGKLKEGVDKASKNMGQAVKDIHEASQAMSDTSTSNDGAQAETPNTPTSIDSSNNTPNQQPAADKKQ